MTDMRYRMISQHPAMAGMEVPFLLVAPTSFRIVSARCNDDVARVVKNGEAVKLPTSLLPLDKLEVVVRAQHPRARVVLVLDVEGAEDDKALDDALERLP